MPIIERRFLSFFLFVFCSIDPKSEIQLSSVRLLSFFFCFNKDEIDLSIIFLIAITFVAYIWSWSKIEIRISSSLEIKQELNCESALSECNDEHLQMCMHG